MFWAGSSSSVTVAFTGKCIVSGGGHVTREVLRNLVARAGWTVTDRVGRDTVLVSSESARSRFTNKYSEALRLGSAVIDYDEFLVQAHVAIRNREKALYPTFEEDVREVKKKNKEFGGRLDFDVA